MEITVDKKKITAVMRCLTQFNVSQADYKEKYEKYKEKYGARGFAVAPRICIHMIS